jgi:hypothetical protein
MTKTSSNTSGAYPQHPLNTPEDFYEAADTEIQHALGIVGLIQISSETKVVEIPQHDLSNAAWALRERLEAAKHYLNKYAEARGRK